MQIQGVQPSKMSLETIYLQKLNYVIKDTQIHILDQEPEEPRIFKDELINFKDGYVYRVLRKDGEVFKNSKNQLRPLTFAERI